MRHKIDIVSHHLLFCSSSHCVPSTESGQSYSHRIGDNRERRVLDIFFVFDCQNQRFRLPKSI